MSRTCRALASATIGASIRTDRHHHRRRSTRCSQMIRARGPSRRHRLKIIRGDLTVVGDVIDLLFGSRPWRSQAVPRQEGGRAGRQGCRRAGRPKFSGSDPWRPSTSSTSSPRTSPGASTICRRARYHRGALRRGERSRRDQHPSREPHAGVLRASLLSRLGDDDVVRADERCAETDPRRPRASHRVGVGGTLPLRRALQRHANPSPADPLIGWYDYGSDLTLLSGGRSPSTSTASTARQSRHLTCCSSPPRESDLLRVITSASGSVGRTRRSSI